MCSYNGRVCETFCRCALGCNYRRLRWQRWRLVTTAVEISKEHGPQRRQTPRKLKLFRDFVAVVIGQRRGLRDDACRPKVTESSGPLCVAPFYSAVIPDRLSHSYPIDDGSVAQNLGSLVPYRKYHTISSRP